MMKKPKLKKINSFTNQLSVSVPWKELKDDYQKLFDRMKSNYTPPGGRKGKVFGIHLELFNQSHIIIL